MLSLMGMKKKRRLRTYPENKVERTLPENKVQN